MTGGMHLIIDGEIREPLSPLKARSFLRHFPRYIEMHRFTDCPYWTIQPKIGIIQPLGKKPTIRDPGLFWVRPDSRLIMRGVWDSNPRSVVLSPTAIFKTAAIRPLR